MFLRPETNSFPVPEHLGRVCDPTCEPAFSCWGPGPAQCVRCRNFTKDGYCSASCPTQNG